MNKPPTPVSTTPRDPLEKYWWALTQGELEARNRIRDDHEDLTEFTAFDLLDELDHVRQLLDDDTTIRAAGDATVIDQDSRSSELKPGTMVDGYRILGLLGVGGMGIVYSARQVTVGRVVALKLIRSGPLATPDDVARFQSEVATTAALQHPGIVAIYDSGVWQGFHYFSMQFVDGPTLREVLTHGPMSTTLAVEMMMQIADAVGHAHDQSILHRDLKPSNVIVNSRTEQPCIADFGLAKLVRGAMPDDPKPRDLTVTGAMVGTPSYMSPEQAIGGSKHAAPSADVYAMGAILYEMLTGRPPFRAATPLETAKQVVESEPVPPRTLNSSIPVDLNTICLRCLAKKPSERYATAKALGAELSRFRRGQPIHARPIGAFQRLVRWCQRNHTKASLIALLLLSLVSGTVVSLSLWLRSERNAALLRQSNQDLGGALQSFYQRALKEDALQHFSAAFNYELSNEMATYYHAMIASSGNDPDVIRQASGQMYLTTESYLNAGRPHDVLRLSQANLEMLHPVASSPSATTDDLADFARVELQHIAALKMTQYKADAPTHGKTAFEYAKRAWNRDPTMPHECLMLQTQLELADSVAEFDRIGVRLDELLEEHPSSEILLTTRARVLLLQSRVSEAADAIRLRKQRATIFDRLLSVTENRVLYESRRNTNQVYLATQLHAAGESKRAAAMLMDAISQFRAVIASAPGVAQHRMDLAETYVLLANLEWDREQHELAIAHYREAISFFDSVIRQDPQANVMMRRSGQVNALLAQHTASLGRNGDSLRFYDAAISAYRQLLQLPKTHYDENSLNEFRQLLLAAAAASEADGQTDNAKRLRTEAHRRAAE